MDGAAGFWSYVQADDEGDQGRVLSLSRRLRQQYRIVTGEALALFVDRESIEWGTEWSERIDDAIVGTTFFIPIITPSYFKSQACRNELLKFTREAQRLGLEQLVMPVYWVTVPALEDDPENSLDEAIRIIGRYQWKDLRNARLEDETSSVFRKTVHELATELSKRAVGAEAVRDVPETPSRAVGGTEDEDEPGLLDKMSLGEEAMPRIVEILEQAASEIAEVGRFSEAADTELKHIKNPTPKAGLVVAARYAEALDAPAAALETLGSEYAAVLADVDPAIHAQLDIAANADPSDSERVGFLRSLVELSANSDKALGALERMLAETASLARFSRSLRAPIRRMGSGLQGFLDGKPTMAEWGRRAAQIQRESPEPGE